MKKDLRSKKIVLKVETLRSLEANQITAAANGITTITTTIFSEGACETYSWLKACLP